MLAAVSAWLWPIGLGGRMLVGGDVTNFSIGLMAVLSRALKAGRLPLWNDLWGFGFPGLAESQMGVFYPPHLALYGLFSTEVAYTASLVLHTYWAALGAYWAGRRFGISPSGAAIAGFSWAASGLFLVHLPHQWGYTTGAWMPWVLGLAWKIVSDGVTIRRASLLAAAMTLQVLPGHFQFAFQTQVAAMGVALWGLAERPRGRASAIWSALAILGAIAAVFPLAAMQLWPTWRLAGAADSQRTYAYLSAFPASPVHLVNYVAPRLFHGSPLWRSFAWDPFHAMPEEHLPYVGLVPLMLALGAIRRESRRDPGVRLLALIAGSALLFSLGPYVPGFGLLIRLPGFSFFRAPARWGLLVELALALLAGKGFDAWISWPLPTRRMARFTMGAAVITAAVVGGAVLALEFGSRAEVRGGFEVAGKLLPWRDDPNFAQVVATTRTGPTDSLVLTDLIRQGISPRAASTMTLDRERWGILAGELGETGVMLLVLLVMAPFLARWPRASPAVFVIFTFADLMILSRHRDLEMAPVRPLVEQSVVLGLLDALPEGSRTIDGLRNLPMVAGAAPVSAYRTLDRPALIGLVNLAGASRDRSVPVDRIDAAAKAVGAAVRIDDAFGAANPGAEVVADPALASWLYGRWGTSSPEASRFFIRRSTESSSRAWFVPGVRPDAQIASDPASVLDFLGHARPLRFEARSPERFEVEVMAETPGLLVVSVLDDPEWRVTIVLPAGQGGGEVLTSDHRTIFKTEGGGAWQAVRVPSRGPWRVVWTYRGTAAKAGLAVSGVAWLAWIAAFVAGRRVRKTSV